MRLSIASLIAVAVVPIAVSAAPIRRGIDPGSATVITFAFVLENLETTFYQQALAKFQANDFTTAGFTTTSVPLQEFSTIANDEATHVSTLQSVAESFGIPLPTCRFDFSSVLTSVETMTPVARLVENVGVAAYMGAMTLIGDPLVLEAAASIMTVEARHQTILNVLQGQTAITQAFDIAFTPPEVLAIAGPFISGCELGITSNIPLTVTNTGAVNVGTLLQFSATGVTGVRQGFCQMLTGGLPVAIVLPLSQCIVPQGISGAVAIWITADSQPLIGNPIDRAEQKPLAGPTMAFIDSSSESLGQLVRTSSNSSGTPPSTNVTTTQNAPPPPPPSTASNSTSSNSTASNSTSTPPNTVSNSTVSNSTVTPPSTVSNGTATPPNTVSNGTATPPNTVSNGTATPPSTVSNSTSLPSLSSTSSNSTTGGTPPNTTSSNPPSLGKTSTNSTSPGTVTPGTNTTSTPPGTGVNNASNNNSTSNSTSNGAISQGVTLIPAPLPAS